jgi:hypothetical protein
MMLTKQDVEALLEAIKKHGRDAEIDWTNRSIRVLSAERTHPNIKMSAGELMRWRDIVFEIRQRKGKK